jgi:hypothetical protein
MATILLFYLYGVLLLHIMQYTMIRSACIYLITLTHEEEAAATASCKHKDTQATIKHARLIQTPWPSGCQSPAGTPAQAV